eukprot:365283-Chlamydomonas_euryale.AAC.10
MCGGCAVVVWAGDLFGVALCDCDCSGAGGAGAPGTVVNGCGVGGKNVPRCPRCCGVGGAASVQRACVSGKVRQAVPRMGQLLAAPGQAVAK